MIGTVRPRSTSSQSEWPTRRLANLARAGNLYAPHVLVGHLEVANRQRKPTGSCAGSSRQGTPLAQIGSPRPSKRPISPPRRISSAMASSRAARQLRSGKHWRPEEAHAERGGSATTNRCRPSPFPRADRCPSQHSSWPGLSRCPVRPKAAKGGLRTWAPPCSSGRPDRALSRLTLRCRRPAAGREEGSWKTLAGAGLAGDPGGSREASVMPAGWLVSWRRVMPARIRRLPGPASRSGYREDGRLVSGATPR